MPLILSRPPLTIVPLSSRHMRRSAAGSAADLGLAIDGLLARAGAWARVGRRRSYSTHDNTDPDLRLWRASQGTGR